MFLPVLSLVLAFSASVANGQKAVYTFVNMSDAQPYNQIQCPEGCGKALSIGLDLISKILGSALRNLPFPVDFCKECLVDGFYGFSFVHKCFTNQEKDVVDHQLDVTFPKLSINCDCDFENSASATAKKINAGKVVEGQCGKEGYANKQVCKPITCEGSGDAKGHSLVKLAAKFINATISIGIRVDSRLNPVTNLPNAFPLWTSLSPSNDDPITYDGSSEFDAAWKCLLDNLDGFFCHLLANLSSPFYDCLNPKKAGSIIHTLLVLFGRCY